MSTIPLSPELLEAYGKTLFIVDGGPVIRIDRPLPAEVEAWLTQHHATHGAILGAENPYSQPASDEDNERRHQALIEACRQHAFPYLPVLGTGDGWQERHFLVANIDLATAEVFRQQFQQNAIVLVSVGEASRLWVGV